MFHRGRGSGQVGVPSRFSVGALLPSMKEEHTHVYLISFFICADHPINFVVKVIEKLVSSAGWMGEKCSGRVGSIFDFEPLSNIINCKVKISSF